MTNDTIFDITLLAADSPLPALDGLAKLCVLPRADAVRAENHRVARIKLARCTGTNDLLQRMATALAFPKTFGTNWDALADCLAELEWLPPSSGYVWLLDHAGDLRDASERDFDTLYDILDDTCARWKERRTP